MGTALDQISRSGIKTACDHALDSFGFKLAVSLRSAFNSTRCDMWQLCFQIGWITLTWKQAAAHTHSNTHSTNSISTMWPQAKADTPLYHGVTSYNNLAASFTLTLPRLTAWIPNGAPFKGKRKNPVPTGCLSRGFSVRRKSEPKRLSGFINFSSFIAVHSRVRSKLMAEQWRASGKTNGSSWRRECLDV